MTKNKVIRQ